MIAKSFGFQIADHSQREKFWGISLIKNKGGKETQAHVNQWIKFLFPESPLDCCLFPFSTLWILHLLRGFLQHCCCSNWDQIKNTELLSSILVLYSAHLSLMKMWWDSWWDIYMEAWMPGSGYKFGLANHLAIVEDIF